MGCPAGPWILEKPMAILARVDALDASWSMICTYIGAVFEIAETKVIYSYLHLPPDLETETRQLLSRSHMEDFFTLIIEAGKLESEPTITIVLGVAPADTPARLRLLLQTL